MIEVPSLHPTWGRSARRFAVTSLASFVTNLGVAMFMHEVVGLSANRAYAIALLLVFFQSFTLLRFYVYGRQSEHWLTQFFKYAPSAVLFRVCEFCAFFVLQEIFGVDYRLAIVLIAGLSMVSKFVYYRRVVFKG